MQNKFRLILIVISTILFIAFSVTFYLFYKQIQNKKKNSETILSELKMEDSRRNEIKTIIKSIDGIQANSELIKVHFANNLNLVPFFDTINGFAHKIGGEVTIASVDIMSDVATPNKNELTMNIKISGSFKIVYQFLKLLENSPYEIEFMSADMQKVGGQDTGSSTTGSTTVVSKVVKPSSWEGTFKIKLLSFIP